MTYNLKYLISFLISLFISLSIIPFIIKFANQYGFIAKPKEDRWHKKPVALLGGIGIFFSFLISSLIFIPLNKLTTGILFCSIAIFSLGLYDDLREIKPQTKFIYQVIFAIIAIFWGIKINIISVSFIAIPLTILWIVGITNAFNILDNMDGLSGGISFIASLCMFLYAFQNDLSTIALFAAIIAGSTLGFIRYNFNPARIFMGDSGSLFLGFILSLITILGTWQEVANLLFVILVPLFILIVPIFDTTLVTFLRTTHGRSISQGGKDHSSHRLVFLGLSEKRTVLILILISLCFGLTVSFLSKFNFYTALIILSISSIFLLFFGIFLGTVKVYVEKKKGELQRNNNLITSSVLLYKKQILQIFVDIILICVAYISAYLLRYEGTLSETNLILFERSLPIIVLTKLLIFSLFGLYKGEWRYAGINDTIQILKGTSLASLLIIVILLVLFRFEGYSRAVFINDYILILIMIGGSRVFLRVFKEYFSAVANDSKMVPTLIMGAGDGGELLLREIRNNPKINLKPVGFIDDDLEKKGKIIHGLRVLGSRDDIPKILKEHEIKKVLISILSVDEDHFQDIYDLCNKMGIECKRIRPIIEL